MTMCKCKEEDGVTRYLMGSLYRRSSGYVLFQAQQTTQIMMQWMP